MFSRIWNKPIIKVDKQGEICPENFEEPLPEDFESFQLGDTPTEDYDQMLFSGSCFTGNKLINKENEVLDKYKCDYQTHNHDDLCETHDKPINDDKWAGDYCEEIWGCWEFEDNAVVRDKNGDVIDRFHCIHFHKNQKERFGHLKKAKKMIESCSSYQTVVKQLKKIKNLRRHFMKS